MSNIVKVINLLTLLFFSPKTFGQENKIDLKVETSKRIFLLTESVGAVYSNTWYAYKLDNGEIALISEGKSKEIRSFINFNCENENYILLASTNFGYNITPEEFKKLVPKRAIDLGKNIQCN
ncbi:hypothetical protein [Gaetbulibacter aestuarii]|uniref:Uncharacterized protein n=1 Tax=Gaetbulibacter aestuarii TaxID=1502358 RepID=A0ABW7MZ44_9FLAO